MSNVPYWSNPSAKEIAYRQADENQPLIQVVRVLAILLMLSAAAQLVAHVIGRGPSSISSFLFRLASGLPNMSVWGPLQEQAILAMLALVAVVVEITLIAAAGACLRRSNTARVIAIICCWIKVALTLAEAGLTLFVTLTRFGRMPAATTVYYFWTYLPQGLSNAISLSLLPAGAAVIFALPSVRRVFLPNGEVF